MLGEDKMSTPLTPRRLNFLTKFYSTPTVSSLDLTRFEAVVTRPGGPRRVPQVAEVDSTLTESFI